MVTQEFTQVLCILPYTLWKRERGVGSGKRHVWNGFADKMLITLRMLWWNIPLIDQKSRYFGPIHFLFCQCFVYRSRCRPAGKSNDAGVFLFFNVLICVGRPICSFLVRREGCLFVLKMDLERIDEFPGGSYFLECEIPRLFAVDCF